MFAISATAATTIVVESSILVRNGLRRSDRGARRANAFISLPPSQASAASPVHATERINPS
jgi:hypothetical protein